MTIAERIQLHRLGYTKEEIKELAAENYDPAGLQDPPADPQPAPEPQPAAAPDPAPQPDNSAILAAINNLTAALQANAIKTHAQPETPTESAEDILFNIIK